MQKGDCNLPETLLNISRLKQYLSMVCFKLYIILISLHHSMHSAFRARICLAKQIFLSTKNIKKISWRKLKWEKPAKAEKNRFIDICPMYILCWYFVYDRHTFSMARCTALLRQKEATDKSPKSEKVMFLDWTEDILLPFWVWSRNTHPAERYLIQDMILHWCQCTWQTHFAHLREMSFSRVASFCQSTAVQF